MLAEIYNWGFQTADLKDAKALLDELAAQSGSESFERLPSNRTDIRSVLLAPEITEIV
jgi:hypothetical protein